MTHRLSHCRHPMEMVDVRHLHCRAAVLSMSSLLDVKVQPSIPNVRAGCYRTNAVAAAATGRLNRHVVSADPAFAISQAYLIKPRADASRAAAARNAEAAVAAGALQPLCRMLLQPGRPDSAHWNAACILQQVAGPPHRWARLKLDHGFKHTCGCKYTCE